MRRHKDTATAAIALACLWLAPAAQSQTLFVCEDEGRTFVVAGGEGPPGCRAVADPSVELQLSRPEPDLRDIVRQLSAQSARIDRLEQMLFGARAARPEPRPIPRRTDRFDTDDRMRDLGQDLERELDQLGR